MILVDAPNLVWRAHFSGAHLKSRERPTAVLHIGLRMLATMPDLIPKQSIMFLWDQGVSWRKKILKTYKDNRDHTTVDRKAVYAQIDIFKHLLTSIGIKQCSIDTMEADDL